VQIGAIASAVGTALIHIYLSFQFVERPDLIFLLNGLGYLVLTAFLYLPQSGFAAYRTPVRWLLIGYTALTIGLWVLFGARTLVGYLDKCLEVALIVFLWLDSQRSA
jgi:hypothetical protein